MSNVVKLTDKKKEKELGGLQAEFDKYRDKLLEHGDKLMARMHDAIRLADEEAYDESIPEWVADSATLGVLSTVLVQITYSRKILSPSGLVRLVKGQIKDRKPGK